MNTIPIEAKIEELFTWLIQWTALLTENKYDEAASLLYCPDYEERSFRWDGTKLKRVLSSVLQVDQGEQLTSFSQASGEDVRSALLPPPGFPVAIDVHSDYPIAIIWQEDADDTERPSVVATVTMYLAINNRWSDLMSEFFLHRLPSGYTFQLNTIG